MAKIQSNDRFGFKKNEPLRGLPLSGFFCYLYFTLIDSM